MPFANDMKIELRRTLRLAGLLMHLVLGSILVVLLYGVLGANARFAVRRWWCVNLLGLLGIRLRVRSAQDSAHGLIAANHVSWLDPVILGALFPCGFVAKAEARNWPLIGWLAAMNETLFLRRESFRSARHICGKISQRLEMDRSVAVFPEGTTTDGSRVLPFRAALFQAAIDGDYPVLPVAIGYRDPSGRPTTAPAWIDDVSLWRCINAIAKAPALEAHVTLAGSIATGRLDRAELAVLARAAVSAALGAAT
ncbi:MAG: lysophospholipid acyltransferase family protein [Vulcanimicrobiaceae bacterium]